MRSPLSAFFGGAELGCYGTATKHAYTVGLFHEPQTTKDQFFVSPTY